MKVKKFESFETNYNYLKVGFMYKHYKTPVCYIGRNTTEKYQTTCLLFQKDGSIDFIEWVNWLNSEDKLPPLDKKRPITIKEYILDKHIVGKTLKVFEQYIKKKYKPNSIEVIEEMYEKLINDKDIMMAVDLEKNIQKYNL
jgi:hypothetical protein